MFCSFLDWTVTADWPPSSLAPSEYDQILAEKCLWWLQKYICHPVPTPYVKIHPNVSSRGCACCCPDMFYACVGLAEQPAAFCARGPSPAAPDRGNKSCACFHLWKRHGHRHRDHHPNQPLIYVFRLKRHHAGRGEARAFASCPIGVTQPCISKDFSSAIAVRVYRIQTLSFTDSH